MKSNSVNAKTDNLPDSDKMAGNEKVGIKDQGYIDKKGTASGESAKFNAMPPGPNIENQKTADIREMPMKRVTPLGYPGDGWT